MDKRDREIQREVGQVLLRYWDPLGVAGTPEASDEYQSYVGGVVSLLARGKSTRELAEHLVRVETEAMGFEDSTWRMLVPTAERLQRLYARLTAGQDCDHAT